MNKAEPNNVEHIRPFSKGYVVSRALEDAKGSVDKSINYATTRLKDFEAGGDKWQEILHTLHVLHTARKMLDDFKLHNQTLIDGDFNDG